MYSEENERILEQNKTETYTSENYVFHYRAGSLAEKEIHKIAETQENAFSQICSTLQVEYAERINYYLCDNPLEIGRTIWGEEMPCNGCALCGRNKIYAVYNENTKCIGAHEDTHLISFLINFPESDFMVEGLAMSVDGLWWGVSNETWTSYYREKYPDLSVKDLFDNDTFAELGCIITYPIAGAFTKYLIDTYGMDRFLEFYKYKGCEYEEIIRAVYNCSLLEVEAVFWERMNKIA
ncbi:MAG: hypothetical protein UHS47_12905, partial [Oscillospiraceae bacterium]|nr:hypothetical protein [Oscillospiraceae bacterium]